MMSRIDILFFDFKSCLRQKIINDDHLKESARLLDVTFPHLKHSCNPKRRGEAKKLAEKIFSYDFKHFVSPPSVKVCSYPMSVFNGWPSLPLTNIVVTLSMVIVSSQGKSEAL